MVFSKKIQKKNVIFYPFDCDVGADSPAVIATVVVALCRCALTSFHNERLLDLKFFFYTNLHIVGEKKWYIQTG